MKRKSNCLRRIGLLLLPLLLFSGCGPREVSQSSQTEPSEIEIFYGADHGEYRDPNPLYYFGSENQESSEKISDQITENPEEDERIVITLAAAKVTEAQTSEYESVAAQFNRENKKYRVELQTCPYGEELQTMRDRLLVEVGAGGGPDLMTEDVFPLSQEIMDSGALVDLTPYLEKSGITRERYFPGYAGAVSGDRIYGIAMNSVVINYCLSEEVLGDREVPKDLEGLVDMLLEYPGKGCLLGPKILSRYVLEYFLKGSEDLWGIIDWEENTCDFTAPIFSKILELTKRGQEDGKKGYDPVLDSYPIHIFKAEAEARSDLCPRTVPIGYYFDDGPHHMYQVNLNTLMINANTEHLEGAYAFVSYILSKAGQSFAGEPVHKEIWDAKYYHYQEYYRYLEESTGVSPANLDEELRREKWEIYEDARFKPRRTEEILEIIYDAADGYIEGDQSREDVTAQIQNRVQLYLNERG